MLDQQPGQTTDLGDLLAKCSLRNQAAFAQLYELTSAKLYSVSLRILNNPTLAEECLQEAFIKIWQKAADYRPQRGQPMTWLISIVRNQSLDLLRRKPRGEESIDTDDGRPLSPALVEAAGELPDDGLARCLEQLGEPQRECVVLAYCEGYTHEELSERLEKPLGTIKTWVRRALLSLRGCLNELSPS